MISLDITNTSLYAVVGKYKSGLITITSANALPLPGYVNTDDSGDKTALSESIKTILADTREKRVNIQFSDSTTISHQYEFPYEKKPANMRSIVQGGLTQNTQDYVMDYVILDIFEKEGSPFCTVQVYLTPRPLVEFAQDIILAAGKKACQFSHC
ncbi:MAG: hypothetical protein ACOX3W_07775 [Christensenellaceae bacterium]|jgi:hypothetical protein